MKNSTSTRLVPVWMLVLFWIVLAPNLVAAVIPMWTRVVLFALVAALTFALLRRRTPA